MKTQAVRFPFPWRTIGGIGVVVSLVAMMALFSFMPVLMFRSMTANTAGRIARNPRMKLVEDRAFTTCYWSSETACYQIAAKLDKGSLMDLKYRLVVAGTPATGGSSGSHGMDSARSIAFYSILSHLDRMIAQKGSASSQH